MKIRGTAAHIYEKYQLLARDANAAGDRVAAENYLQHAEHYYRILSAYNAQNPNAGFNGGQRHFPGNGQHAEAPQNVQQPRPGAFEDEGDDDLVAGDEGDEGAASAS